MLCKDINYGENLDSKRMKSYWDEEKAISYKAGHKRLSIRQIISRRLNEVREG